MKLVGPQFGENFFVNQVLDLKTGKMFDPIDYSLPLRYCDEAYVDAEEKILVPRFNVYRFELEMFHSDVFDFTPLWEQGLKLPDPESEPLFLTPDQFFDFQRSAETGKICFRFFEHVEEVMGAEEILYEYEFRWREILLRRWAQKHGFLVQQNPRFSSEIYIKSNDAWIARMKQEHPRITLDHQFSISQAEVNSFHDMRLSDLER